MQLLIGIPKSAFVRRRVRLCGYAAWGGYAAYAQRAMKGRSLQAIQCAVQYALRVGEGSAAARLHVANGASSAVSRVIPDDISKVRYVRYG